MIKLRWNEKAQAALCSIQESSSVFTHFDMLRCEGCGNTTVQMYVDNKWIERVGALSEHNPIYAFTATGRLNVEDLRAHWWRAWHVVKRRTDLALRMV